MLRNLTGKIDVRISGQCKQKDESSWKHQKEINQNTVTNE